MQSRVLPALINLFKEGKRGTKHQLANIVFAHHHTVQGYLTRLHKEKKIRIYGWEKHYQQHIPIYALIDGRPDAEKPKALDSATQRRLYRQQHPIIDARDAELKRRKRRVGKQELSEWLSAVRQVENSFKRKQNRLL